VAFFLLFDLGVLVLKFYTSFKIDQDTVAINLAGASATCRSGRPHPARTGRARRGNPIGRTPGRAARRARSSTCRTGFQEGATVPAVTASRSSWSRDSRRAGLDWKTGRSPYGGRTSRASPLWRRQFTPRTGAPGLQPGQQHQAAEHAKRLRD
jgi:hypothetical protein